MNFYRFSFHTNQREDRIPLMHQVRDGDAFAELAVLYTKKNLNFSGVFFNYQSREGLKVELSENDLVVVTTRPPLNNDGKKNIPLTNGHIESLLLKRIGSYIRFCSRKKIWLSDLAIGKMGNHFQDKGILEFSCKEEGLYTIIDDETKKKTISKTMFYYFHLPPDGDIPFQICFSFGVSGILTLCWNHILRTRFSEILSIGKPCFIMAEATIDSLPQMPLTLDFCKNIKIDIVANAELP